MYQHDFILLDRSQSMTSMWGEALSSVNAYVKKLADDKVDTGITVAVFDGQSFDIIRDRIIPNTFQPLTDKDAMPRGMTPLNDSIGKIVNRANAGPPWGGQYDKVAIIIMTDGEENASRELNVQQAKDLLQGCRNKGWQVIFLGANFDNVKQATSYGTSSLNQIQTSAVNLVDTMAGTATLRSAYSTHGTAMNYGAEFKSAVKSDKKVDPSTLKVSDTTSVPTPTDSK